MNFVNSLITCYKKIFSYSGRASRSEYWWFQLYYTSLYILIFFVKQQNLVLIVTLLVVINIFPGLAVGCRRMHDINKSGWWISLMIVPIFNLYILYLLTTEGSKDENRFGAKPEK